MILNHKCEMFIDRVHFEDVDMPIGVAGDLDAMAEFLDGMSDWTLQWLVVDNVLVARESDWDETKTEYRFVPVVFTDEDADEYVKDAEDSSPKTACEHCGVLQRLADMHVTADDIPKTVCVVCLESGEVAA